jgi:hypothetical protein
MITHIFDPTHLSMSSVDGVSGCYWRHIGDFTKGQELLSSHFCIRESRSQYFQAGTASLKWLRLKVEECWSRVVALWLACVVSATDFAQDGNDGNLKSGCPNPSFVC